MTSLKSPRRISLAAVVCAALAFSLPGCATPAAAPPAAGEAPAKVEKNADTGIAKLTLTQRGIDRLELKTEPVTAGSGTEIKLPYGALMYDANGKTWVYTNPAPRVYERQELAVSRVEAGVVTATAGPPAGTQVVTVGAAELFGSEFNTGK